MLLTLAAVKGKLGVRQGYQWLSCLCAARHPHIASRTPVLLPRWSALGRCSCQLCCLLVQQLLQSLDVRLTILQQLGALRVVCVNQGSQQRLV